MIYTKLYSILVKTVLKDYHIDIDQSLIGYSKNITEKLAIHIIATNGKQ